MDTPTLHFILNFKWAFTWIGPINVPARFEVRSFIWVGVANPQFWGRGGGGKGVGPSGDVADQAFCLKSAPAFPGPFPGP